MRREVNHSHQAGAEVKNEWSHTFTTPIILHAVDTENFSIHTAEPLLELQLKYIIHMTVYLHYSVNTHNLQRLF